MRSRTEYTNNRTGSWDGTELCCDEKQLDGSLRPDVTHQSCALPGRTTVGGVGLLSQLSRASIIIYFARQYQCYTPNQRGKKKKKV